MRHENECANLNNQIQGQILCPRGFTHNHQSKETTSGQIEIGLPTIWAKGKKDK